ncbi:hypothetical protein D3C79_721640 [compost metagenome]
MTASSLKQGVLGLIGAEQFDHFLGNEGARCQHKALAFHGIDARSGDVDFWAERLMGVAVDAEARPGGQVNFFALGVKRVLRQGLEVLPAA